MNTTRNFKIGEILILVIIPIILLIMPSDYFDSGETVCLSVRLFNMECYGCGLTRSIMHLIHFEFSDAYYFNPLGFIVFPIIAILSILRIYFNIRFLKRSLK